MRVNSDGRDSQGDGKVGLGSEIRFQCPDGETLEVMAMEVLARNGEVKDVLLDGYLRESSSRMGRTEPGRHIVFGYIANGVDVPKVHVMLIDGRVRRIEPYPEPRSRLPAGAGKSRRSR